MTVLPELRVPALWWKNHLSGITSQAQITRNRMQYLFKQWVGVIVVSHGAQVATYRIHRVWRPVCHPPPPGLPQSNCVDQCRRAPG